MIKSFFTFFVFLGLITPVFPQCSSFDSGRRQTAFKDDLKFFRIEAGLTQLSMAHYLNLYLDDIKGLEDGTKIPSKEILRKICHVLNLTWYRDQDLRIRLKADIYKRT